MHLTRTPGAICNNDEADEEDLTTLRRPKVAGGLVRGADGGGPLAAAMVEPSPTLCLGTLLDRGEEA